MAKIEQRNTTRNQSTLDIAHNRVFVGDNAYEEAEFLNNSGAELELLPGTLVLRNAAGQVVPAVDDATLANVIGIVTEESTAVVADAGTLNINFGYAGKVNEAFLVLPGAATLDTVHANKTVRDHLNALGFELTASVENTKLDN